MCCAHILRLVGRGYYGDTIIMADSHGRRALPMMYHADASLQHATCCNTHWPRRGRSLFGYQSESYSTCTCHRPDWRSSSPPEASTTSGRTFTYLLNYRPKSYFPSQQTYNESPIQPKQRVRMELQDILAISFGIPMTLLTIYGVHVTRRKTTGQLRHMQRQHWN